MPGSDPGGASSSREADGPDEINRSDVMFTMMMVPHHQQAIEMSEIIRSKSGVDSRVRNLAHQIAEAQGREIELMEAWLDDWRVPSMGDMGHGNGMMSDDDVSALEAAEGPNATRLYLERMMVHHEGAIVMAEWVIDHGNNADVRALSRRIIESQTLEIATMRRLLTDSNSE